jgi:hypothetical protein
MKLSDRKIEALATKILVWMDKSPDVELLEPHETILDAIVGEFQDEKDKERKLDEDVDKILAENESRMRSEGLDTWVLRKKIRQQLARERRLIL